MRHLYRSSETDSTRNVEATNIRHRTRIVASRSEDHEAADNIKVCMARAKQASDALGKDMPELPETENSDPRQGTHTEPHPNTTKIRPLPR